MNRFYQMNKISQWLIALLLLMVCLLIMGGISELIQIHLAYLLLFPLAVTVFQFAGTPILALSGIYQYLSPMLLVFSPTKKRYEIHNGTPFDYWIVMRGIESGKPAETQMLIYYLEGLQKIIAKIQAGELPETVKIEGTSYFFSDSTARRFGFTIQPSSLFMIFNAVVNYLDLFWMFSYAKGKWTFPNLLKIKKAHTDGKTLVAHRETIAALHQYLSKK